MDAPVRRLAAVLFADLVGYSSLSSTDESAALALVRSFQAAARTVVGEAGGRVVKFIGDAAFAEFGSTAAAVRAAIDLRDAFAAGRDGAPSARLRIAVHVGDCLVGDDEDLYGDGVNVAARLQNEADPGQIVVSQDVWRQLRQRREFGFTPLGERRLKGIASPVWVFAVGEPGAGAEPSARGRGAVRPGRALRVAGAAVAYLVASAAIVVSSAYIVRTLELGAWVLPAAVVLLGIGLVVVLGTAWVQSRPPWERSVDERPPWALDVSDLLGSVTRRRLPDPTWPRAIVGGAVAFALLFGAAGGYLWVRDVVPGALRPTPLLAAPEPALAILPFGSEGDPEMWREGVPDLLALMLDGVSGLRVIDARVVYDQPGSRSGDSADARRVGQAVGARFTATGDVRRTATGVRLGVGFGDAATGRPLGSAEVEGHPDSLSALIDELALRIIESGTLPVEDGARALRLRDLATASPVALREYLVGERHLRRSNWAAAAAAFERAGDADPGFALALFRLSLARSWAAPPHELRRDAEAERAFELSAGLPERQRLLIEGLAHLNRRSADALPVLERVTTLYPDDPDGWFLLGDALFHLRPDRGAHGAAFEQAIELAPGFGPAYPHLIEDLVAAGDTARARALVSRYASHEPGSPMLPGLQWALRLARPAAAGPGAGAPSASADVGGAALDELRTDVGEARERARRVAQPALAARMAEAEALWEAAAAAAAEGRFDDGASALIAAASRYEALRRDGELLGRIAEGRSELEGLRDAVAGALPSEVGALEGSAQVAVEERRYDDAARMIDEALAGARAAARRARATTPAGEAESEPAPGRARPERAAPERAAAPPDAGSAGDRSRVPAARDSARTAAPGTPTGTGAEDSAGAMEPAAAAETVLARLGSAMEAEDLGLVRAVWTSISTAEAEGLERLFGAVRDLSVDYEVRSLAEEGPRIVATVATTYRFVAEQGGEPLEQRTTQVFEMERVDGGWVIVASGS